MTFCVLYHSIFVGCVEKVAKILFSDQNLTDHPEKTMKMRNTSSDQHLCEQKKKIHAEFVPQYVEI